MPCPICGRVYCDHTADERGYGTKEEKAVMTQQGFNPCPICGRVYCDHTPDERRQTMEQMMVGTTVQELNEREESTNKK